MKGIKIRFSSILLSVAFIMLILDTKSAIGSVQESITLCISTVIPSVFPFMVLSPLIIDSIPSLALLHPLENLLRIPRGSAPLLLSSFLCGYPVGAKLISNAYSNGQIHRQDAKRMLSFCNNAGPSFIFGIGSSLFDTSWYAWAIWGIHIISCLCVAYLIPGQQAMQETVQHSKNITLQKVMENSVKSIAYVCGWIISFRLICTFLSRWLLWLLPLWGQTIVLGLLELSGGCISLHALQDIPVRFITFSAFLAFGGFAVHMQTASVIQINDGIQYHLTGKLLHCLISLFLSAGFMWCTTQNNITAIIFFSTIPFLLYTVLRLKVKKSSNMKTCSV